MHELDDVALQNGRAPRILGIYVKVNKARREERWTLRNTREEFTCIPAKKSRRAKNMKAFGVLWAEFQS